jgi:hypothetical protein
MGGWCHDSPSKFFISPLSYAGPSIAAPSAPAPLAQSHHVHPPHYAAPAIPASSTTPFYDQTTYYTIKPLDHVMEDVEPGAASPRDVDMQGSTMPKTPSPESDGLPFHPKYHWALHLETMSPTEFRGWLRSDPLAPPLYGSQPTSSGHTQPVSPSSSNSAPLRRQITPEGLYSPITHPATPAPAPEETPVVAPADGPSAVGSRCSPRSPFGGLLPLTPLVTQVPIASSEPIRPLHSRQSSGGHSYRSSPAVETADIPEGLLPSMTHDPA